jgi:hypothetical protein
VQVAAALQRPEVLEYGIQRCKMKVIRDLFHAWRITVVLNKSGDKIQDFLLSFGQFHYFTFYTLE